MYDHHVIPAMPLFFIYRPWNPAVPGAPCRWSSRWCGCGTSLGVQWESSQACMWQLISVRSLTILLSIPFLYLLCPCIPIWSSPPGHLFGSSLAYSSINNITHCYKVLPTIFTVEEGKDGAPNLPSEEQNEEIRLCDVWTILYYFNTCPIIFHNTYNIIK